MSPSALRAVARVRAETDGATSALAFRSRGVAELAAGNVDGAIDSLERAADTGDEIPVRIDLSVALLERWHRAGRAFDLARALDETARVVHRAPQSAAGLFNHALVLDALGLAAQTGRTWRAYLRVDGRSDWAAEVRKRLAASNLPRADDSGVTAGDAPMAQHAAGMSRFLIRWAKGEASDGDAAAARLAARTTVALGGDTVLPSLVAFADESQHWNDERRRCLRRLVADRDAARLAFDQAQLADAAKMLEAATADARCAGVALPELDVLTLQVAVNQTRDAVLLDRLRALEASAIERGNWELVGRIRQSSGAASIRATMFDRAVTDDEAAIAAFRRAGDDGAAGAIYSSLGEVYCLQGQNERAWESHRAALQWLASMHSYRQMHTALSIAASCAESAGMPGAALVLAEALADLARTHANGAGLVMAHLYEARSIARLSEPLSAVPLLGQAHDALSMVADPSLRRAYATEVEWFRGDILRSARPREAIDALDRAYQAFEAVGNRSRLAEVLLARGTAELTLGDRAAADRSWSQGAAIAEEQRAGSARPELRISRLSRLWDLFGNLVQIRKADPVAALSAWERGRARVLLDALGGQRALIPLEGPDLYRWLPGDTIVVAYSVHRDELLVFVITRDGVELMSQAIAQTVLETELSRYIDQLQKGEEPSNITTLSSLILPLDPARLDGRRIVLIPDGPLHTLPFATLRVGSRRLVELAVPIGAASLTTLKATRMPGRVEPNDVVVAAAGGSVRRALPSLPGARVEVERISQLYGHAKALYAPDVTRGTVLAALSRADLFHFAGHAVVNERYPSESGIVVAQDTAGDLVSAGDVAAVRLRAGMTVVLSACDTARGAVAGGEGVASLARAFAAAGAGSVVATLWRVPDQATAALMVEFHSGLRQGLSPADALARSQRTAIRASVSASKWGAFQVHSGIQTGAQ